MPLSELDRLNRIGVFESFWSQVEQAPRCSFSNESEIFSHMLLEIHVITRFTSVQILRQNFFFFGISWEISFSAVEGNVSPSVYIPPVSMPYLR
uniref:Uncharacterized protein n=1 Tax=Anguilla anguilla TaxID=7936 RepID=A0A0E9X788_ANGAN